MITTLHSIYLDQIEDASWNRPLSPIEYDVLLLVTRGEVIYRLGGEEYLLHEGDMLYMAAGTMREGYCRPGTNHHKYSAHFSLADEPRTGENNAQTPSVQHPFGSAGFCVIRSRQYDYVKHRFVLLVQQWIGRQPYYEAMCRGILQELFILALREHEEQRYPSVKMAHVAAIRQYILDHYREPIRIEELAKVVERTPNYVTSIYREVTGLAPIDYMHSVRLSAARELLLNTQLSIREISEQLGYCDQAYFNRVYKKRMGSPPSALLKERANRPL
ncbi:helix-turn-helix domain-containing protein [Paenibacillus sp. GCM10023252]|uniref:helix-turn-helix domain-containing protein n=1 Tax=Paenibacillus sp. GCM10023252 TaxID=3252649 RepID=UPI00360EA0EE